MPEVERVFVFVKNGRMCSINFGENFSSWRRRIKVSHQFEGFISLKYFWISFIFNLSSTNRLNFLSSDGTTFLKSSSNKRSSSMRGRSNLFGKFLGKNISIINQMQPYLNQMNSILTELFVEYARVYRAPGILLSGGIDSSMISYFVSSNFKEYTILSMGTEKTKDKKYIDIMSDYLKKPYIWIDITEQNLATDITVIKQLL